MPKAKLVLKKNTPANKIEVAGYFSSVKTGLAVEMGDELHVEVSYPGVDALVKFGSLLATVAGTELDKKKSAEAEKAAKKKA